MTTTVWLFEPRSRGRRKEATRARNGGPCRGLVAGATTQFSLAPSTGVSGFVPMWARSIFSSSCVVVRAWCLEVGGAASGGGAMRMRAVHAACMAACSCVVLPCGCGCCCGSLCAATLAISPGVLAVESARAVVAWRARWVPGAREG